ncbi:substrate-binding domain-containing protein [Streptomyces sp. BE20]|nr:MULTISPECIES: substrate-binding domain-containing protein [unclassified Streptomyces]MED7948780.1 substrate-binding domain-containing protein [Streptomyces sp. BE303]MEE1821269.1 substrate-binding domain-containing protein [Streptomyces sp. BE20]
MEPSRLRHIAACLAAVLFAANAAGCENTHQNGPQEPLIGIDLPRTDTDFWRAYAGYLTEEQARTGARIAATTTSQGDAGKLAANLDAFERGGTKALVVSPQQTQHLDLTLDSLFARGITVVSVDARPESGTVFMVVRADNRAYGTKACEYLGAQLAGKGKVVELQGSQESINGFERSEAFAHCMRTKFPGITVIALPTEWKADIAEQELRAALAREKNVNGLYLQAGGVFLEPVLAVLREKGLLKPAGQAGHIGIVSNDGTPQELDAIRSGEIDATVSQPADLYAKYALYYAREGAVGRHFSPGPTDHGSVIVALPNGLEDQLPAPLVTRDNVDDPALWANRRATR